MPRNDRRLLSAETLDSVIDLRDEPGGAAAPLTNDSGDAYRVAYVPTSDGNGALVNLKTAELNVGATGRQRELHASSCPPIHEKMTEFTMNNDRHLRAIKLPFPTRHGVLPSINDSVSEILLIKNGRLSDGEERTLLGELKLALGVFSQDRLTHLRRELDKADPHDTGWLATNTAHKILIKHLKQIPLSNEAFNFLYRLFGGESKPPTKDINYDQMLRYFQSILEQIQRRHSTVIDLRKREQNVQILINRGDAKLIAELEQHLRYSDYGIDVASLSQDLDQQFVAQIDSAPPKKGFLPLVTALQCLDRSWIPSKRKKNHAHAPDMARMTGKLVERCSVGDGMIDYNLMLKFLEKAIPIY